MVKKQKIQDYINETYVPGSRPCVRTFLARVKRGEIEGLTEADLHFEGVGYYIKKRRNPLMEKIIHAPSP